MTGYVQIFSIGFAILDVRLELEKTNTFLSEKKTWHKLKQMVQAKLYEEHQEEFICKSRMQNSSILSMYY